MATLEKAHEVFDAVAWRYDLTNRVISGGLDVVWRNWMSRLCVQAEPKRILDVACGTGDQLISLNRYVAKGTELVGVDLLEKMIRRGVKKLEQRQIPVEWFLGDGVRLPFAQDSFDAITISWGLRNLPAIDLFLNEARRVLKPNGVLWVLEFSTPSPAWFRTVNSFYLRKILPVIGKVLTGSRASYDYLAQSVENFPDQETLKRAFLEAGFREVCYFNLARGVVAVHKGIV